MKHGIVTFEQPSRKFEKVYAANFGYVLIDGYRFFIYFFYFYFLRLTKLHIS